MIAPSFNPATSTPSTPAEIAAFKAGLPNNSPTPGVPAFIQQIKAGTPSNVINTSTQSRTQTNQASAALDAATAKLAGTPTVPPPAVNPPVTGSGATTPGATPPPATQPGAQPTPPPATPAATPAVDAYGIPTNDPIMTGLNTLSANSDAATKALIANTMATYQRKIGDTNKQFDNYKRGLQQLGVETNAAQATPDLLAGHIQQAANDQMDKINNLNAEENKAIIDAQTAKASNDFKTLQAKMDYVKQVQTAKSQAIKDMYDGITNASKAAAVEAHDVYDVIEKIDPADKEEAIQLIAQKYNIPVVSLVTALADEGKKRDADALKTANTKSIIANRGSSGGSSSTSKGGGTDGGYSFTGDDVASGTNLLNKGGTSPNGTKFGARGSDGYADPNAYLSVYNSWIQQGGTPTGFLKKFPVTNVNPSSYSKLPTAILPKKTSSDSSSDESLLPDPTN